MLNAFLPQIKDFVESKVETPAQVAPKANGHGSSAPTVDGTDGVLVGADDIIMGDTEGTVTEAAIATEAVAVGETSNDQAAAPPPIPA